MYSLHSRSVADLSIDHGSQEEFYDYSWTTIFICLSYLILNNNSEKNLNHPIPAMRKQTHSDFELPYGSCHILKSQVF